MRPVVAIRSRCLTSTHVTAGAEASPGRHGLDASYASDLISACTHPPPATTSNRHPCPLAGYGTEYYCPSADVLADVAGDRRHMIPLVEQHRSELEALCRKYCVARLDLFGSAAAGRFEPQRSDLDFLVEFQPDAPMGPFHQYFDFLAELEQLFVCPVDLVERQAIKNPYFNKAINASRKLLYAA